MCFRPPETDVDERNICGECGTENPPGEPVCQKCGSTIELKPIQPPKPKNATAVPSPPTTPKAPPVPAAIKKPPEQ